MSNFKERLEIEKTELKDKIDKLDSFITSENFITIDLTQQSLLRIQFNSMLTYFQCLTERLSLL